MHYISPLYISLNISVEIDDKQPYKWNCNLDKRQKVVNLNASKDKFFFNKLVYRAPNYIKNVEICSKGLDELFLKMCCLKTKKCRKY